MLFQSWGASMDPSTEAVLHTVLALPDEERAELIDAILLHQAEIDELPFDKAWLVEIARRSNRLDTGKDKAVDWAVVRERVRDRVEGRLNA